MGKLTHFSFQGVEQKREKITEYDDYYKEYYELEILRTFLNITLAHEQINFKFETGEWDWYDGYMYRTPIKEFEHFRYWLPKQKFSLTEEEYAEIKKQHLWVLIDRFEQIYEKYIQVQLERE